jgi:Response regulator containing CheY-like receiver domain and AraC-type DNA-binding domain
MAKILIVDDSLIQRINLKKLLTANGHEIVGECSNGAEAVKKYRELMPDLVTMDITMPEMNGLEALRIILGDNPKAKVIMISALGQEDKILEALGIGALHYITKPYEPEQVFAAVSDILCTWENFEFRMVM